MNPQSPQQQPAGQSQWSQRVKIALISAASAIIVAIVAYVLSPIVVSKFGSTPTLTPTASPTTTPTASGTTSTVYPPSGWKLVPGDLLETGNGTWQEDTSCKFTADGYQISVSDRDKGYACLATNSDFTDFAFEVQMKIVIGYQGGMTFRSDPKKENAGNEYYFHIDRAGAYKLDIYDHYNRSKTLTSGMSTTFNSGLDQSNMIAVVAKENTITLYVNNQQIPSVNDNTYTHGRIGLIADTNDKPPTEVIYSNVKVWTPGS